MKRYYWGNANRFDEDSDMAVHDNKTAGLIDYDEVADVLNEYEDRVNALYDESNSLTEYAHQCMAQVETLKSAIYHVREAQRHLEDDYPHSTEGGQRHHVKSAATALRQAHSILSLYNDELAGRAAKRPFSPVSGCEGDAKCD